MKIVGVGCGPSMLTLKAVAVISEAHEVHGSARALELAAPFLRSDCIKHLITDYSSLRGLDSSAVVLSTGDPMLAGLGYLDGDVIPGISSLSYAAAKLHIKLADVMIVNAHGRDHPGAVQKTVEELSREKIVFLLADPLFMTGNLAEQIHSAGLFCEIIICEALGYPEESFVRGSSEQPPVPGHELFSLFIIRRDR